MMPPMGGEETPPMGATPEMDGEMIPPMDNTTPMDGTMPTDFDTNFDAGVEADEETDPKTYIQQLTGKLSQSLNSYNNENGEPDTELGKYVLGMLVKQGTKGMDDKDRKEIIKKINTSNSEGDDMPDESMEEPMDEPMDEPQGDEMGDMQMESKTFRFTKKQIFESFGVAMDNNNTDIDSEASDTKITPDTNTGRSTKPFRAPKKFRE